MKAFSHLLFVIAVVSSWQYGNAQSVTTLELGMRSEPVTISPDEIEWYVVNKADTPMASTINCTSAAEDAFDIDMYMYNADDFLDLGIPCCDSISLTNTETCLIEPIQPFGGLRSAFCSIGPIRRLAVTLTRLCPLGCNSFAVEADTYVGIYNYDLFDSAFNVTVLCEVK
eukprot:CAMPEP_0118705682 /NCGR_PEP_ID=MMETSP0800-20121206/20014_1 /TAXON_ID=210618 ORGANISM="Striatella unipunctata, Strain CCMP2910" /NCGR_SAMPLE_ID=MMETSP0800 /ASSEMBLY_ACC=CAM_ASM_000638 /LENGTH=169 /DNA_ID=CAMNT_0006607885 /DNA_START=43 /DNA_END=552 /DNA_ORIENTATION=-